MAAPSVILLRTVFLAALFASFSFGIDGEAERLVGEGVYGGRGGSIIIHSESATDDDAGVIFADPAGFMGDISLSEAPVDEVSIVGDVANAIGVQSPVVSSGKSKAGKETLFGRKARLTLTVAIDGLSQSDITPGTTPYLGAHSLSLPGIRPLRHSSYPSSPATTLTNVLTGHTPASHGIVAGSWRSSEGEVKAYSSSEADSARGSLADVLSQTFSGKSLIIAAGGDRVLARSVGPHIRAYSGRNILLWTEKGAIKSNSNPILKNVGSADSISPTVTRLGGTLSVSGRATTVSVNGVVAEYVTQSDAFVALKQDLSILAAAASVLRLRQSDGNVEVYEAIHDDVPDYIAVAANSLRVIAKAYPEQDAPQVHVAQTMIDEAIRELMLSVTEAYGTSHVATFLALGRPSTMPANVVHAAQEVLSAAIPSALVRDAVIFTPPNLKIDELRRVCDTLSTRLSQLSAKAYCVGAEPSFMAMSELLDMRTMGFMSTSNSSHNVTSSEIVDYQIFFWTWVVFAIVLLSALCMLLYMPVQKDTLLYPAGEFEFEKLD